MYYVATFNGDLVVTSNENHRILPIKISSNYRSASEDSRGVN